MERSGRLTNKIRNNLRMKASSLYFLNDISNIDSTDCPITPVNWRDEYTFNPMTIGRGHFSKVYKVKCCSTGSSVAIKVIRRRRMGADKIDEIMQEVEIMNLSNKSSNSGFIQLLKVHTNPSEVAIVMEFASGGPLYNVTEDSGDGLPDIYVRIVLTKILTALSYLHQLGIVHLDIKADNILLRYPYPSTDVALSDFGLTRKLSKSKVHREMIGTPDYVAPEVVNYEEISLKSDMWSVGVLTYFLLTNISPFSGENKDDTLHRVTKIQYSFLGKLLEEHSHLARTFISRLIVKAPESRLSTNDCLSHDFLSNIPIIDCSMDKSSFSEVPVTNLDYQVQVRENAFCHARGMVMSQYDIDSTNNKHSLMECNDIIMKGNSDNAIVTKNSTESLKNLKLSQNCDYPDYGDIPIEMETSVYSIDQINEIPKDNETAIVEDSLNDCYRDVEELEEMIDHIRNKSDSIRVTNQALYDAHSEDKLPSNVQDNESLHNDCNDHSQQMDSSFTDNGDNSLSEITASCHELTSSNSKLTNNTTETSTSESCSVLIKDESYKENHQPDASNPKKDLNFQKTSIYDSRRRSNNVVRSKSNLTKNSLISASFRNSRENIIDNFSINRKQPSIEPRLQTLYNIDDSGDDKTATLRSSNDVLKRRSLLKSIKKDSDKPQLSSDKSNRHSEILLNTKHLNGDQSDFNFDLSTSNATFSTDEKVVLKKRSTLKLTTLFKNKKPKESKETKWNCVVS